MATKISITKDANRETIYRELIPQVSALIADEPDFIANLANTAAVLREAFGFFWVGFYLAQEDFLVLGPFQGSIACTRIAFDQGVCGNAFTKKETVIVADVDKFPRHIACSSESRSEIVVPIFKDEEAIGVLDVDSDKLDDFSNVDRIGLEKIAWLLTQ